MSVSGDPFLAPRGNTDLILAGIRQQLFHHRGAGRQNVVAFRDAFRQWDSDGDLKLNRFELEKALGRCGVFLPVQEISALFRRFDSRGDGHVDTEQVLAALRVPLNERRSAVVEAAFSAVQDSCKYGARVDAEDGRGDSDTVPLTMLLRHMKPDRHPEVIAGRLLASEVEADFRDFFLEQSSKHAKAATDQTAFTERARVTLHLFREYYRDVGVCEPYDAVFIPVIEALWGVTVPRQKDDKRKQLQDLLRQKLLQHAHNTQTPAEVFKRTLRYYSVDRDTMHPADDRAPRVNYVGLERAFNEYGLYPDVREIEEIFKDTGCQGGQSEDVDKLIEILCPPEPSVAPMF